MIFEKKVNRAMDWLKEQNTDERVNEEYKEEYIQDEALFDEGLDYKTESSIKEEIEKNDILALLIAAFLMFTPVIILVLGLFVLFAFLFV